MPIGKIKPAHEGVFYESDVIRLLSHDNSRKYGKLALGSKTFGLSWRSEIVEPEVSELTHFNILIIGIDQRVVGLNVQTLEIEFSLCLNEYFKFVESDDNMICIVCETSIIMLNGKDRTLFKTIDISDTILDVNIASKSLLKVETMEGWEEVEY